MKFTRNIGFLLLAVFLILYGIGAIGLLAMPGIVMGILAIAAGIFIYHRTLGLKPPGQIWSGGSYPSPE